MIAVEVLQKKRKGLVILKDGVILEGKNCYLQSPFAAPPYIDWFWRTLILDNEVYWKFCDDIIGSFIDWDDPRDNGMISY